MKRAVRVLVCRVGRLPVAEMLAPNERDDGYLDAMQAIVGGLVECVGDIDEHGLDLWCNEEGMINELPLNRVIPARAAEIPAWMGPVEVMKSDPELCDPGELGVHRIHGDFFFARVDEEGGLADVTDLDVETWTRRFDALDVLASKIANVEAVSKAARVLLEDELVAGQTRPHREPGA